MPLSISLCSLEQEDGGLAEVEVDKVPRLMRHERAKVSPHNTVPDGLMLAVKLLLDVRCNVLLDAELVHGHSCGFQRSALQLFTHVGRLDDRLAHQLLCATAHWLWLHPRDLATSCLAEELGTAFLLCLRFTSHARHFADVPESMSSSNSTVGKAAILPLQEDT